VNSATVHVQGVQPRGAAFFSIPGAQLLGIEGRTRPSFVGALHLGLAPPLWRASGSLQSAWQGAPNPAASNRQKPFLLPCLMSGPRFYRLRAASLMEAGRPRPQKRSSQDHLQSLQACLAVMAAYRCIFSLPGQRFDRLRTSKRRAHRAASRPSSKNAGAISPQSPASASLLGGW